VKRHGEPVPPSERGFTPDQRRHMPLPLETIRKAFADDYNTISNNYYQTKFTGLILAVEKKVTIPIGMVDPRRS
jgi:hypothetical protein